jgi:hypothetical protein
MLSSNLPLTHVMAGLDPAIHTVGQVVRLTPNADVAEPRGWPGRARP